VALVAACFAIGVAATARVPIAEAIAGEQGPPGWRHLLAAARRPSVLNALALLHLSDLLGDVLSAFLALYLVDAAGWGPGAAASALALWAGAGLVGDALAVPVLDRYEGRAVVRISAVAAGALYTALLVVDSVSAKLVLLALLGLSTAGWYPVLQARLFATMPGRSGVAISLGSASGIVAGVVPLALGLLAQRFGLASAMWVLLVGPLALVAGLRRRCPAPPRSRHDTPARSPA
jgi:FSR family fosmidomycin resistance protein-like MFS transporter